jgi:hypothetical protein
MFSCSLGNISFLRNKKEEVRVNNNNEIITKGESLLSKGRFLYLCILLSFGKTLGLMPSNGNLPYNLNPMEVCQMTTLGVL